MNEAIANFVSDVKRILSDDGPTPAGLERVAERMAVLVRDPAATGGDPDEVSGNFHTGQGSGEVYTDDTGLTLMRARFGPEEMTPIHNHGSWGVIGLYRGRDRYQIWRRLDEGAEPGKARVELVEERVLEPGDVAVMPPPPQDIHAQQGIDGPAYEFVLFGRNAARLPRLYFDPEAGTTREVSPGRR